MMKVGEIFLPDDQDFRQFKIECTTDQGWTVCYDKSSCRVATKKNYHHLMLFVSVYFLIYKIQLILFYIFRFNQNLMEYQVIYSMMLYMMVNIVQHGIQLCWKVMKFVLFYRIVI
jgi:hypothetical protein